MHAFGSYVLVFLGAGVGGAFRHAVNERTAHLAVPGTLVINVVGSFAIGLVVGYFAVRSGSAQSGQLFLATGVLGGFTTFSAFSLEVTQLIQRGHVGSAVAYAGASVGLSILGTAIGLAAARAIVAPAF